MPKGKGVDLDDMNSARLAYLRNISQRTRQYENCNNIYCRAQYGEVRAMYCFVTLSFDTKSERRNFHQLSDNLSSVRRFCINSWLLFLSTKLSRSFRFLHNGSAVGGNSKTIPKKLFKFDIVQSGLHTAVYYETNKA